MYLGGFIHRDRLFKIAMRWLGDHLEPDDAWNVTEIFAYEGFVSSNPIKTFLAGFLQELHGEPIEHRAVSYKHQVKEAVVRHIPDIDHRTEFLIKNFKSRPEEYFPRAPFNGLMLYTESNDLVGMYRIKRARRVAEKVSRRMADLILDSIRNHAKRLAEARASMLGIPFNMLLTSDEEMVNEFEQAERRLAEQFTLGEIPFGPNDIALHDAIGIKIIGKPDLLEKAEKLLMTHPDIAWVEREIHSGSYNAVNIQVDLKLPPPEQIIDRVLNRIVPPFPTTRGISLDNLLEGFPLYVESGARTIRLEIILTTYPELIESEIGRSVHEERTLKQRKQREYTGRIAKNAEFIIEYLLSVAFSPKTDINFIPVKLSGHYLPETISHAIRRLYGMEENALFSNITF
ncbi:hypothetical protein KKF34_16690 [Myxococcota bacterium]|nr:hypothetical protein [Myxococcota bacterium]MBU1379772.1 hypothetical protein [Myxococcota bacterium]MBU1498516.1 hypothetical protein [Myxococcota bacterium]